jgi:hypothetical protein
MRPSDMPTMSVESLLPYAANSRTHSENQVAQIAASITEFGFTNPVLVDGKGTIIAGHGRVLAARALGLKNVPVLLLDHLSKKQQRAYVIADNKLALNAGWDEAILKSEVEGLLDDGFEIGVLGFDENDIDALLAGDLLPVGSGIGEEGSSGVSQKTLNVDGVKVAMTDMEAAKISSLLTAYGKENGMLYGFVAWLTESFDEPMGDA